MTVAAQDGDDRPTCISVCSGIGGLDHGLARAGFRHLAFCESDPWRRGVLAARFSGVPVYDDLCTFAVGEPAGRVPANGRGAPDHDGRGEAWAGLSGGVALVAGGTPCQDLSVAGQRAGLTGSRSNLFFEFVRVVDAVRPRWFLWENVPGALSSDGGRDFGIVLGTLADIGYGLAWRVLDSRFFGVPQRRRRVFVLGAVAVGDPAAAAERAGAVLAVGSRCGRHPATRGEAREDVAVASLSGLGSGGPDDNDGQGGRLIAETVRSHPRPGSNSNGNLVASALTASMGQDAGHPGFNGKDERVLQTLAATLSAGSHPGSNMPGRRREDDTNLVAYPISGDALRGEGTALTPSPDATGNVRLRDPGFAVGDEGDPAYTLSAASPGAVAFHQTQDPIHGDEFTPALGETSIGMGVGVGASVRRLTPVECERLQGLPDGWTDPHGDAPDSRRYAGLGDAVTSTVGEWIGRRIIAAGNPPAEDGEDSSPREGALPSSA